MMRHFKEFDPHVYVCVRGDNGQTHRIAGFEQVIDARRFVNLQPHWRKKHLFLEDRDGDEAVAKPYGHGGAILEKLMSHAGHDMRR